MDLLVSGEESEKLILHFYGKLDYTFKDRLAEYESAFPKHKSVEFELSGVEGVDDTAILHWVRLMDRLPQGVVPVYSKCSPAAVFAFNSVPELVKKAHINSVLFAGHCNVCENDFNIELSEDSLLSYKEAVTSGHCEKCFAKDFEVSELPEVYFEFLSHSDH